MQGDVPSRTARLVATVRGRASARTPKLCSDPYGLALGGELGAELADAFAEYEPDFEIWIGLRTARLDRLVANAVEFGLRQVVLLGAGLDTRAQRLARKAVRYFEVDHPASTRDKLERLRVLELYEPGCATYVPCDFTREHFFDALYQAGFDPRLPTFFLWEGVTFYLPELAVRTTLQAIATEAHPQSVVAFDVLGPRRLERSGEQDIHDFLDFVEEPLFFATADPVELVGSSGFRKVVVESFDQLALEALGSVEPARRLEDVHLVYASVSRSVSYMT